RRYLSTRVRALPALRASPTRRASDLYRLPHFVSSVVASNTPSVFSLPSTTTSTSSLKVSGSASRHSTGKVTVGSSRSCTTKRWRSEEHTSELQSRENVVCGLLLEQNN